MRTIPTTKEYSYLSYPVKIKDYDDPDRKLHLTAKFFGSARINPAVVSQIIAPYHGLESSLTLAARRIGTLAWEPVMFGELTHVMELTMIPPKLKHLHDQFNLIEDQFPKKWRPHITVNENFWLDSKLHKYTPKDVLLSFGEPELYLGQGATEI